MLDSRISNLNSAPAPDATDLISRMLSSPRTPAPESSVAAVKGPVEMGFLKLRRSISQHLQMDSHQLVEQALALFNSDREYLPGYTHICPSLKEVETHAAAAKLLHKAHHRIIEASGENSLPAVRVARLLGRHAAVFHMNEEALKYFGMAYRGMSENFGSASLSAQGVLIDVGHHLKCFANTKAGRYSPVTWQPYHDEVPDVTVAELVLGHAEKCLGSLMTSGEPSPGLIREFARLQYYLADCRSSLKRYDQAASSYLAAFTTFSQELSDDHPFTRRAASGLFFVYEKLKGRDSAIAEHYRQICLGKIDYSLLEKEMARGEWGSFGAVLEMSAAERSVF